MEQTIKPVKSGDRIPYHCKMCGECCRHVKDQIMLEPLDAYHLGQFLQKSGVLETVDEVYGKFAHPVMLADGFPIFALNTQGKDDSCVFLRDGRCSIYEARLRVCRLYPLTVSSGVRGKKFEFYQCLDRHADHFVDHAITVKDWTYQNFTKADRLYFEREAQIVPRIGKLIRAMTKDQQMSELFHILFYRYYDYDLGQPFMEQYDRNHAALLATLRSCCGKEIQT